MGHDLQRILCGTDFTERSYGALAYALRLARLADCVLVVAHAVHVPTPDIYAHEPWPRTFEDAKARAAEALRKLHRTRLGDYAKTELVVEIGAPAEMLLALARERQTDLVVTATHGRSELAELIMGSTAEKLIRHAPCPVLVVRQGVA